MNEKLKMSFYNGTLDKKKAIDVISQTSKELKYRYGFSYRGAKANSISKEEALNIINKEGFLDFDEYDNEIILNVYSLTDMW